MKRSIKIMGRLIEGFLILLFLLGTSYAAPDIPALRDAKDGAEKDRIQALMKGARAEGKLIWAANMIEPTHGKYMIEGFKDYYGLKDLKIEFTYSQSAHTIAQVEQQIKAGRPTLDIAWYVAWAWFKDLMMRDQLVRYESPYYKEYTISNQAGNSMPGYWVSDGYTFSPMWNPAALAKGGIKNFHPSGWQEFADGKLGKYSSIGNIVRSTSYTAISLGLRKTLGDEWFIKIAKMKLASFVKSAQGRDWCASGEYPIDLFSHAKNAETVKKTGVEIKLLYPKEGVVLLPFSPVILRSGKNQNAAKLFIDYVRSVPGTNRMAASGVDLFFGRPGVKMPPNEFLPPTEKIKAIVMDWNKEDTIESSKELHNWLLDIGLSY